MAFVDGSSRVIELGPNLRLVRAGATSAWHVQRRRTNGPWKTVPGGPHALHTAKERAWQILADRERRKKTP